MRRWGDLVPYWPALIVLAALDIALIVAASHASYFPGDVAFARLIQGTAPLPDSVAKSITATADRPGCWLLLAFTFAVAGWISGWRAALVAIPVFFGLWFFGLWLSPIAAQLRPSPDLIRVVGHPHGFAFPSIFGLVYAATFGYLGVLGAIECGGALRLAIPAVAVVLLVLGAIARVDLGAHWPSDLWVAYLIGLFWILLLLPMAVRD